jgi:hypothetical protein
MSENETQSPPTSRANRDPGFVKLRRGLRKHLPLMSSNAAKLYTWLLIAAEWKGAGRGTYESTYKEIAEELRWNVRMLRRSINELREKGYVLIVGAANQYENTLIKILKYDQDMASFGGDSSVRSNGAEDSAEDTAVDTGVPSSVLTKAASPHSAKALEAPKNLEEVKEVEEGKHDAVRRRFDAERRVPPKRLFSPSEKKKKLAGHLTKAISAKQDSYRHFIETEIARGRKHPFENQERQAFSATRYKPDLNSPLLSFDFVMTVVDVYEEAQKKDISPGNLCSRIIDRCQTNRERDGEGYYWPPDFQEHRDRLREEERGHLQIEPTTAGVRA